jgi:hypothetical protein
VASGDRSLNRPVAAHLKADDASSRKKKKSKVRKKVRKSGKTLLASMRVRFFLKADSEKKWFFFLAVFKAEMPE